MDEYSQAKGQMGGATGQTRGWFAGCLCIQLQRVAGSLRKNGFGDLRPWPVCDLRGRKRGLR